MTKKLNPLEKFRRFWVRLPPEEREDLWDVITMLRGPDTENSDIIKAFTTARIRGKLIPLDSPLKYSGIPLWKVKLFRYQFGISQQPLVSMEGLPSFSSNVSYHFISHYIAAYKVFKKYGELG